MNELGRKTTIKSLMHEAYLFLYLGPGKIVLILPSYNVLSRKSEFTLYKMVQSTLRNDYLKPRYS
jgi:hypothetical protein